MVSFQCAICQPCQRRRELHYVSTSLTFYAKYGNPAEEKERAEISLPRGASPPPRKKKSWLVFFSLLSSLFLPLLHFPKSTGGGNPTNNGRLLNFQLSSDANILLKKHRLVIQVEAEFAKIVYAMCTHSDCSSILHTTLGGWEEGGEKQDEEGG